MYSESPKTGGSKGLHRCFRVSFQGISRAFKCVKGDKLSGVYKWRYKGFLLGCFKAFQRVPGAFRWVSRAFWEIVESFGTTSKALQEVFRGFVEPFEGISKEFQKYFNWISRISMRLWRLQRRFKAFQGHRDPLEHSKTPLKRP